MPASAHVLVTLGGTFGTGANAEIWQCGIKMTGKASDGSVFGGYLKDLTGYVESVQAALQAWWVAPANQIRADFNLNFLKAANIGPGTTKNPYGVYAGTTDPNGGPNPGVHSYGTTGVAGGVTVTTGAWPQILTLASTFRKKTAPRGPRHSASHGRIYLPFNVSSTTDRYNSPTQYVTATSNLLNALVKASVVMTIPVIGDATVALRPALVGVNGTVNLIDRVEVGDVVDTVRNRKSKLRENYTGADYI